MLIVYEAWWVPEPVWTGAENLVPTGIRSPGRPDVASLYTDRAIPAHLAKKNASSDISGRSSSGRLFYQFLSFLPRRWRQYFPPITIITLYQTARFRKSGHHNMNFQCRVSPECRGRIWCREDGSVVVLQSACL